MHSPICVHAHGVSTANMQGTELERLGSQASWRSTNRSELFLFDVLLDDALVVLDKFVLVLSEPLTVSTTRRRGGCKRKRVESLCNTKGPGGRMCSGVRTGGKGQVKEQGIRSI